MRHNIEKLNGFKYEPKSMSKSLIFILVLTLLIGLKAPNFAYGAALAPESQLGSATPDNSVQRPPLQEPVQSLMEQAQNKLQEGASKAVESAQEAAKSEIQRQIEKQVQAVENAVTSAVKKAVDIIKENIGNTVLNIKTFFINIKNKIFQIKIEPPIQI